MPNNENNNRLLTRYNSTERRDRLLNPDCTINGIDYKEVYYLRHILNSRDDETLPKESNPDASNSSNKTGPKFQNYTETDQVIIILYCFKPLEEDSDKNNILIQGFNQNNNNIIINFAKRGDLLLESLRQKKGVDEFNRKNKDKPFSFTDEESTRKLINFINKIKNNIKSENKYYYQSNGTLKKGSLECTFFVFLNNIYNDSLYTIEIIEDNNQNQSIFDPIFSIIDFRFQFKKDKNIFDCKSDSSDLSCPLTQSNSLLNIDYLSKDYSSFRRLMLDRIHQIMPQWKEQSPADIGMVLIELLAYVGDQLSYFQDAIGTECYLGTSRSRISLNRHARLLNYSVNEGCNARVWVSIEVENDTNNNDKSDYDGIILPKGTKILTFSNSESNESEIYSSNNQSNNGIIITGDPTGDSVFQKAIDNGSEVFETVYEKKLYPQHNKINFYTWGSSKYILYKGATNATLLNQNKQLNLKLGDILIFEELRSPETFNKGDADPRHRHAVRINKIEYLYDHLCNPPMPVLNISWNEEDALPFSLCVTNKKNSIDNTSKSNLNEEINGNEVDDECNSCIAYGNIVLADHGYTVYEILGETPKDEGRFNPSLSLKALTNTNPEYQYNNYYSDYSIPANNFILYDRERTEPVIYLEERTIINKKDNGSILDQDQSHLKKGKNNVYLSIDKYKNALNKFDGKIININQWKSTRDIFNLNEFDNGFITEVENDGTVYIRFGDGYNGQHPLYSSENESHLFSAIYRVGNGIKGNVNADTINRIKIDDISSPLNDKIIKIRNPLAAQNAMDSESSNSIRKYAPSSINKTNKAVTEEDYVQILQSHPEVKSATVAFEWTGSWYIISIVIERYGRKSIDNKFKENIISFLGHYRLLCYDLKISGPVYVPLFIELNVEIDDNYFQNEVRQRLVEAFGNTGIYCTNSQTKGLFHPDNMYIGQQIFYDRIWNTAMSIPGVISVSANHLSARNSNNLSESNEKYSEIHMAKNEIPIINNDPDNPSKGKINFVINGGL